MTQKQRRTQASHSPEGDEGQGPERAEDPPTKRAKTAEGFEGVMRALELASTRRRSSPSCSTSASCARSATTSWWCRGAPTARSMPSPTGSTSGSRWRGCVRSARRARAPGSGRCLDYGDFVVHVFLHSAREHYDSRGCGTTRRASRSRCRPRPASRRTTPTTAASTPTARRLVKITLAVVGRLKESYFVEAEEEYRKRLRPYCTLAVHEAKDAAAQLAAIPANAHVYAFDERGTSMSSVTFAEGILVRGAARRRRPCGVRDRRRRRSRGRDARPCQEAALVWPAHHRPPPRPPPRHRADLPRLPHPARRALSPRLAPRLGRSTLSPLSARPISQPSDITVDLTGRSTLSPLCPDLANLRKDP